MIFARHGHTEYLEYTTGQEFDLTETGVNQAIELSRFLQIESPLIVSSEQHRARAFAQVLYDILGGSIAIDSSLNSFVGEDTRGYKSKVDDINGRIYQLYKNNKLNDVPEILVPREELQMKKKGFLQRYAGNVIAVTHREVIDQWFGHDVARGQSVIIN